MNCIKCKESIQAKRLKVLPDTKVCVKCSDVDAVSCVNITYHKTGNTIQVMPKEQADKINKLSQRSGFGIMRSMKGSSGGISGKVSIDNTRTKPIIKRYTKEDLDFVGAKAMKWIDLGNRDRAIRVIDDALQCRQINGIQRRQLMEIIDTFIPPIKKQKLITPCLSKVDKQIDWAFRNWKSGHVYK